MNPLRFFTDEDIYRVVAEELRANGFDAVSTPEANRLAADDESQLEWAATEGRSLITFNVPDFSRLHHTWIDQHRHHAGIIVSQQRPIGDLLRRLLAVCGSLSVDDMHDRLEYLSNWPA